MWREKVVSEVMAIVRCDVFRLCEMKWTLYVVSVGAAFGECG